MAHQSAIGQIPNRARDRTPNPAKFPMSSRYKQGIWAIIAIPTTK